MKNHLQNLVSETIKQLVDKQELTDLATSIEIKIEHTKNPDHGDFATNIALMLAKPAQKNPRELAQLIVNAFPTDPIVSKTEIAGPGFINFFVDKSAQFAVVPRIIELGDQYGLSSIGADKKVQVEFVSANPTGPLHVGHGRGAAYGASVANLLTAVGFQVEREYYVNDAGRQMAILAVSIWLRYLQVCGEQLTFPCNAYQGDYIEEIANQLFKSAGNQYQHSARQVFDEIPVDEPAGGDKELHIDALIERAKSLLEADGLRQILDAGLKTILGGIKTDLEAFSVHYDQWFSERSLMDSGAIDKALATLEKNGYLYEKDGAKWFASSRLGDEKDRVVVRDNGQHTYFASDIAYHLHKLERGFDKIINVWGADHHGYVPRVKAAMQALGADADKLDVLLVQFAVLYRGDQKIQMSTRSGEFVTLRELIDEVGKDATRFFYVMRKSEQHMDFDLELAKSASKDNPVYYIQYAHARICSVFRELENAGLKHELKTGNNHLTLLTEDHEQALLKSLTRYPEIIEQSALHYEPHRLVYFLQELANDFHTYYNAHKFLVDNSLIRNARLNLVLVTRQVIANGLSLLNIESPEEM
ncbi:MAG: arginine--tRNA ligase [Methylococcales bacterium]